MASTTVQTQPSSMNSKEGQEVEEGEIGTTDADTSSWESEPHTTRSSRQYHPVKGEHTAVVSDDEDNDLEVEPFTNGGAPGDPNFGDQELLSSQYLRKTFGLGQLEKQNPQPATEVVLEARAAQSQHDQAEDTRGQNGYRSGGQSSDIVEDEGMTGRDRLPERDERSAEDIEELDLTKEPKPSRSGRGVPGMPQAQIVSMPTLGPFSTSPFGSLMTGLLSSDSDGFENDADVSSQSEAEAERPPRAARFQFSPGLDGRSQQERWEHLFGMLEQQHRQQVVLQQEHHERQVRLLQMQLARLAEEQEDLITKQHQEPLGRETAETEDADPSRQGKDGEEDSEKQPRRSPNGKEGTERQDKNARPPSLNTSESGEHDTYSASGDSDVTLEGSLEDASETLMTTWSDVVEQKQAEMEKQEEKSGSEKQERNLRIHDSRAEDDRFTTLQNHFAKQQRQLQEQYAHQARHMQRQWAELQTQQQQQQEVLRHLLSRQQERITQTHRDMRGATQGSRGKETEDADLREEDRGTPTSDDTSTVYSDFTYWKQAEQDTYRALPDLSADDVTRRQESPQPETTQSQRSPHRDTQDQGSPPDLPAQWMANSQRSPHISGQSSSPRRSADDGDLGEDAQLTTSLRLNLREKQARHIADLKAYYESEIQELQSKLTEATSLRDHSPDKVMERTHQRLQDNCVKLEAALKSANSRIEDLENTVKALEARLGETYSSTDSSLANLQQKVDDLKQLCRHKELDVQSLEKRNRELQVSLDQAYQLQDVQAMDEHREQKILKRVLNEYKALAEKHEITKGLLHGTETQLYESKAKISGLTRTLTHLEFEVKRMDLDSSILKRQSLSKSLSGTSLRSGASPNTAPSTSPAATTQEGNTHSQGQNQTPGSAKDASSILDAAAVARSVEERKFLRPSANYNILTGEALTSGSGSESLRFTSDTESNLSQPDDRANLAAPDHHGNFEAPFDTDTDEERPLSPMMKAARQLDVWKAEESVNAGSDKGPLRNGLNGTQFDGRPDGQSHRTSSLHHNNSASISSRSHDDRGRHNGGSLTTDASIHIWPASEKATKHSPVPPGSSKLGAALAHSSPKQLARRSLAKAIKPSDHDLFPVRGAKDSPQEISKRGNPALARQSLDKAPCVAGLRKGKESPRRQLFADDRKSNDKLPFGGNVADSILAKVRAGDVQTRAEWEGPISNSGQRSLTPKKRMETGHDIIQRINDHQEKLDKLMMEKRQDRLEQRLEHVTQELGSVRMLLRKYNALKSSI